MGWRWRGDARPVVQGAPAPYPDELVRLAYRAVLRRDEDAAGLAAYGAHLRAGRDLAWLIDELARSDEFQAPARRPPEPSERPELPQLEAAHILAHRHGLRVAEIQPDTAAGKLDRWISNTFLLIRDGWNLNRLHSADRTAGTVKDPASSGPCRSGNSETERAVPLTGTALIVRPPGGCRRTTCRRGRARSRS